MYSATSSQAVGIILFLVFANTQMVSIISSYFIYAGEIYENFEQ